MGARCLSDGTQPSRKVYTSRAGCPTKVPECPSSRSDLRPMMMWLCLLGQPCRSLTRQWVSMSRPKWKAQELIGAAWSHGHIAVAGQ